MEDESGAKLLLLTTQIFLGGRGRSRVAMPGGGGPGTFTSNAVSVATELRFLQHPVVSYNRLGQYYPDQQY
jgi:hypothetical protein